LKRYGLLSTLALIALIVLPLFFAQAETEDDLELPDLVLYSENTSAPTSNSQGDDADWGDVPAIIFENMQPTSTFSGNNPPVLREDVLTEEERGDLDYDPCVFNNKALKRSAISAIEFVDHLDDIGNDAWDVSMAEDGSVWAWTRDEANGKRLFIAGNGGVTAPGNCSHLFVRYENLEEIRFNSCFFTGETTNMHQMFGRCRSLAHLDVTCFDTRNVTDFSYMFSKCERLTDLDVQGFDTSAADTMQGMFSNCASLESIDVSGFNTANVTDMSHLFSDCSRLTGIDVSNFDTGNVSDMNHMFNGCSALTAIDLRSFDTSKVERMNYMFYECANVRKLDVSRFDTGNVINMSHMFSKCSSLSVLETSRFNTSRVESMNDMFNNCGSLESVDVSHFDTGRVTDMYRMFNRCKRLKRVDASGFNTCKVTNASKMFSNCTNLEQLDVSDRFILLNRKELNTENMFASCHAKVVRDGQAMSASDWIGQASIKPDMAKGDTGHSVRWLQRVLIQLGYLSGQADGIWGDETEEGLKRFQSASGLGETGRADEETIEALCNR